MTAVKTVAIVQARMGSTRLPGKVLADIAGRPMIAHVLTRTASAARVDETWLACSDSPADTPLAACATALGFPVFRGDEDDVLSRYAVVARKSVADRIVRITGDCPLIDPAIVDAVIALLADGEADYACNTQTRRYPDGLDVEAFTRAALEKADREASLPFLRAHVTPYIHGRLKDTLPWGGFHIAQHVGPADFSALRWTVDEPRDLDFLRRVVPLLPEGFGWMDVVALLAQTPALARASKVHGLNEGTGRDLAKHGHVGSEARRFDRSNQLYARALKSIPLASQTFSKSAQQWVKGSTPLFFTRGEGCRVEDIDGNRYIDYVLGLLPVVLGHRDPDVDAAIMEQLDDGILFSLATPLECELAERLVRLIPCAEMVRFGKNGSDATSAAVRLARAHTGRDKVALCGYHGWHDWYIGTTTRNLGVPAAVRGLSATFPFNDADPLEAMLHADPEGYACVILEPDGVTSPTPGFLERLRDLTERYGVLLVFDEVVTGFRIDLGGAQALHGVTPDLACFGKAMGNGMPISAVVGPARIMGGMEDIFFSGTFGGEALSLAASIATIDKLERESAVPRLAARGARLKAGANAVLARHGFAGILQYDGADWWPRLKMTEPPVEAELMTSLLRQEFVAEGLFLGASFNLCLAHDFDAVEGETLTAMDRALDRVRHSLDSPDPATCLRGEQIRPVFAVR